MRGGLPLLALSGGGFGPSLMAAITAAGLTSNLQLCLDIGDMASWPGSGAKWLDLSGNGYDFFLGADGASGSDEPIFVGSIGSKDCKWSFDRGFSDPQRHFTYDSANEASMNALHKNNAAFTMIQFFERGSGSSLFRTASPSLVSDVGIFLGSVGAFQRLSVMNGSGVSAALEVFSDPTSNPFATGWNMGALSLDEAAGAGGSFFYANGGYQQVSGSNTFNGAYSSPSAAAATEIARINYTSGETEAKRSSMAFWSSALSKANLDALWAAMRPRYRL